MDRPALWSQTDTVLSSLADKIYSEFMANLITAPLCDRYCLIGLHPDLESNTNTVLLYEPVAKRACSGHDDTHSNAPGIFLKIFILIRENNSHNNNMLTRNNFDFVEVNKF